MRNLDDFNIDPDELTTFGYERRDEPSTDTVRRVWFEKSFSSQESQFELILQIEFDLGISDNPHVTSAQNHSHTFNAVFLRSINRQMKRINSSIFDEETAIPLEVDRHRLAIKTLDECELLAGLLRPE